MGRKGRAILTDERVFFVTTVVKFVNVFSDEHCCDILIRNIKHYQKQYQFSIFGYVIMPTHFHWSVAVDPAKGTISDIMRDLKKYGAWDLMDQLEGGFYAEENGVALEANEPFVGARLFFVVIPACL